MRELEFRDRMYENWSTDRKWENWSLEIESRRTKVYRWRVGELEFTDRK